MLLTVPFWIRWFSTCSTICSFLMTMADIFRLYSIRKQFYSLIIFKFSKNENKINISIAFGTETSKEIWDCAEKRIFLFEIKISLYIIIYAEKIFNNFTWRNEYTVVQSTVSQKHDIPISKHRETIFIRHQLPIPNAKLLSSTKFHFIDNFCTTLRAFRFANNNNFQYLLIFANDEYEFVKNDWQINWWTTKTKRLTSQRTKSQLWPVCTVSNDLCLIGHLVFFLFRYCMSDDKRAKLPLVSGSSWNSWILSVIEILLFFNAYTIAALVVHHSFICHFVTRYIFCKWKFSTEK